MTQKGKPRKPLETEEIRAKIKKLAKDLGSYIDELELHPDPTTNTAYRRRLKVLFGLSGYSGEMHAGDLRLRHAAIKAGSKHIRRFVSRLSKEGYSFSFGTAVMQLGRATLNERTSDLIRIKKKWSNFVNRVLKPLFEDAQVVAFLDSVEIRERNGRNGETFFDFHIHFLCALKGDPQNIQAVRIRGNQLFKSSTMPEGGFKISKINKETVHTAGKNMAYMLKPPLWHMTTSRTDGGQLQAQKSRKRSLSGILLLLEHLRLMDFKSLLIVSGRDAMEVRKGLLKDLKGFHDAKTEKQKGIDRWRSCSRCSRHIMRLGQPFECKAKVCDLKLFHTMRESLGRRRKMPQPPPAPICLTSAKEKYAYNAIRHGAIESL